MTVEAETAAEYGPGGTYTSYELYDESGRNAWSYSADDVLTYRQYDSGGGSFRTGALRTVTRNAPGDSLPTDGVFTAIAGYANWGDRSASVGTLISEYVVDQLGRTRESVTPGLVSRHTLREMREIPERPGLLYYAEVSLPHEMTDGQTVVGYNGEATLAWFNASGGQIGRDNMLVDQSYGFAQDAAGYLRHMATYSLDTGAPVGRSRVTHDVSGLVMKTERWPNVASPSSVITESYSYDDLGRVAFSINANGTVTRSTYDALHRVTQTEVGIDDGLGQPSAMSVVETREYDNGASGNSNLTSVTRHVGASGSDRVAQFSYDARDRLTVVQNPVAPHAATAYDNLDRPVVRGAFESLPGASPFASMNQDRTRVSQIFYSQRGLVCEQATAAHPTTAPASPPTGTPTSGWSDTLASRSWFDEVGRAVGSWAPSAARTKTQYDAIGRLETAFTTDGSLDSDYTDVHDQVTHSAVVAGDHVLEQVDYRYLGVSGLTDLVASYRRVHGTSIQGSLSTAAIDKRILTFAGVDYDLADRVKRMIDFGTNSAAGYVGAAYSAPDKDEVSGDFDVTAGDIVTEMIYDERGFAASSRDGEGKYTSQFYDHLGRVVAVAENHNRAAADLQIVLGTGADASPSVQGAGGGSLGDEDRITAYAFNGLGSVVRQIAYQSDTDTQVTDYVYGVTPSDTPPSEVTTEDLLREVRYPERTGGAPGGDNDEKVRYAFNLQGEVIQSADQNATSHVIQRDALGRVTLDQAAIVDPNIDTSVMAIQREFDASGRLTTVSSLDDSSIVLDQVAMEYDALWRPTGVDQEFSGAVTATTLGVSYGYADSYSAAGGNYARSATMTYPDGTTRSTSYGSSNTIDHTISRVKSVTLGSGSSAPGVSYDYIGSRMLAAATQGPKSFGVVLDRQVRHDGQRIAGEYAGYDRFGHVIKHAWVDSDFDHNVSSGFSTVPAIVEIDYGYDMASIRTHSYDGREGARRNNRDFEYGYDGLDRLIKSDRGAHGANFTHVPYTAGTTTFNPSQAWSLDSLGNWDLFVQDTNQNGADASGGPTQDEVEPRTHNDINELQVRTQGLSQLNQTYDDAGNMRTRQIPPGPLGGQPTDVTYTHDAWNRLVEVKYGSAVRVEHRYNGMSWRISKTADTDADGQLDERRLMFYTVAWQLIEERIDADAGFANDPAGADIDEVRQYLWGNRYIDDIVVQRSDPDNDGVYEDLWHHLTDAQFSTVALLADRGSLVERVSYDAYGEARHHWREDVDGDGDVDGTDSSIVYAILTGSSGIGGANYNVDADLDRDGDVDFTDYIGVLGGQAGGLTQGEISAIGNAIGWDGYLLNREVGEYTVRHRHYAPELGRWLERDPVGYADGSSLVGYVRSMPVRINDPLGLEGEEAGGDFKEWQDEQARNIENKSGGVGTKPAPGPGGACAKGDGPIVSINNVRLVNSVFTYRIVHGNKKPQEASFSASQWNAMLKTWGRACIDVAAEVTESAMKGVKGGLPIGGILDLEPKATIWLVGLELYQVDFAVWKCKKSCNGAYRYSLDRLVTMPFVNMRVIQMKGDNVVVPLGQSDFQGLDEYINPQLPIGDIRKACRRLGRIEFPGAECCADDIENLAKGLKKDE